LAEERVVAVSPLPISEDTSAVCACAAWKLLEGTAPPDALAGINGQRAQRLLQLLDGLPLAIELAAGRLEVLSGGALEQRMADRFALLSDPGRTGRSALYDALDRSWSLLSEAEGRVLARLSAFVSPFSLEAAEHVVAETSVLDLLHRLVRKSLIQRTGHRL